MPTIFKSIINMYHIQALNIFVTSYVTSYTHQHYKHLTILDSYNELHS